MFGTLRLMLDFFRRRRREAKRNEPFPGELLSHVKKNVPQFLRLTPEDQKELLGHTLVFMSEKSFEGAGGLAVTDEMRVTIAAQASMLLLHRDTEYYPELSSIVIYPTAFKVKATRRDASGVVTEEDQVRLGESWGQGTVVLAWDAVLAGGRNPDDGQNVVLHELAHQLDQEDGAADGAPILDEAPTSYRTWGRVLGAGYKHLRWVDAHHERSVMNRYGATDPAEFFAVLTETFFEKPKRLKAEHPELYEQMALYYRQDPVTWRAPR
jgi:MtfA peptidase